ncbi:MAG: hypothetical protein VYD42_02230 [Actinomycetota bacterium]|nr:hypothetical protein [Actinomycetota bacterium]
MVRRWPNQTRSCGWRDSHHHRKPASDRWRWAHGQVLAIDRLSGIVVAHMGSASQPPSTLLDSVMQPLLDAIIAAGG